MMSAKIFVTFLVVAALVACIEGQYHGGRGGHGGMHGGRGHGGMGHGGHGGHGGSRFDQGNHGGSANLAEDQRAYNVNFGKGDLNNQQGSRTAQSDSQGNYNGPYRGQGHH